MNECIQIKVRFTEVKLILIFLQASTFRWNNSPMSYQCWSNVNFGRLGLPEYKKYHTSHVYEQLTRDFLVYMWTSQCLKNTNSFCKTVEPIYSTEIYNHHILYPISTVRKQCTLLLLLNLAQPQWVSVDCNTNLINHVVCFSRKKNTNRKGNVANSQNLLTCEKPSILYKKSCYFFFQCEKCSLKNIYSTCRKKGLSNIMESDSMAHELFSVISQSVGEIDCDFATINKKKGKVHYFHNKFSVEERSCAFLSCKGNMIKQNEYIGLVYKQYNGHFSSVMFLYDGKQQRTKRNVVKESCKTPDCTDFKCNTSVFFYKSISGNCSPYSQQDIAAVDRKIILVPCKNSKMIEENLMNDLVSDCGLSADDEPKYKSLLLKKEFYQCPLHHLPCRYGHSKCYSFHELCIFRLNKYLHIIPCRTGSHLEFCNNFECNVHFKCPGYYCIPWGYTCDGKWDCPNGYDESTRIGCGLKRQCKNMFHCRESQICLHLEDICDGYSDCPLSDDEFLCALKREHCLKNCMCYQFAVVCTERKINYRRLHHLPHICYHLTFLEQLVLFVLKNNYAVIVNLTHNSINNVCTMQYRDTRLSLLDLSHNNIAKLSSKCFSDSSNLRKIILRNNSMSKSEPRTFMNLKRLFLVDLANNMLETLPQGFFINVSNLYIFILYDNPLNQIEYNMFAGISIKIIHSKMISVCCISKDDLICTKTKYWFNLCDNLLPNVSINTSFIMVSLLVLLTNMLSFLGQVRKSKIVAGTYLIITSAISFTNMSLTLYFMIYWFIDMYYADNFVLEISKWKKSATCIFLFSGFLSFKFLEPFLLSMLLLARLMVVKYPIESKFKSTKFTSKRLLIGILLISSFSMVCGIIAAYQGGSPDILCLPFVDPTKNNRLIKVTISLATSVQIFTISATISMHILMLTSIKKSENITRSNISTHYTTIILRQIIILSLLKIICWISSNTIYLTAMFMDKYPPLMIYWTTVLIVPINAITIPILLSFTVVTK